MQQTGRSTSSGNASAVFVVSAAQLEMRNNLFAYTNADLLGSAFLLNDQTLVGSFVADTNWYASPDPNQLRVAWNGARVTWAKWLTLSGQDAGEHQLGAARRSRPRASWHPPISALRRDPRSVSRTIWSARRCPPSRRPT